MDGLLPQLFNVFGARLIGAVSLFSVAFWGLGVFLLHQFHPQPLPFCSSGGADLCGVLAGDWERSATPIALFLGVVLVVSTSVLASAQLSLNLLSGPGWWWHVPGTAIHNRARRRAGERQKLMSGARAPLVARVEFRLRWYPYPRQPNDAHDHVHIQATLLGNIFAATHQRIRAKHGLLIRSCARQLINEVPQDKRVELQGLSNTVIRRVHAMEWLLLAMIWVRVSAGCWFEDILVADLHRRRVRRVSPRL